MKDKRIVVEFSTDWKVDNIEEAVKFLQRAIREYRMDDKYSGGKWSPERLAKVGNLKEVIGARILDTDDEIVVVMKPKFEEIEK